MSSGNRRMAGWSQLPVRGQMVLLIMTKRRNFFGKLFASVWFPLIAFHHYWREFDGAYTDMDLLLVGVVTVVLGTAIFMYFPITNKIETYSPAWFLGLLILANFFVGGWIMTDPYFLPLPIAYRAWGEYIFILGLLIPVIHFVTPKSHTSRKGSFFKRIRLKPIENNQT